MADDDKKPNNVIQFTPRPDPHSTLEADVLLEDCIGEYEDVVVIGVDAEGETTVSGNIADIAWVYEMLSSAAQNIAMAHLEMLYKGTEH